MFASALTVADVELHNGCVDNGRRCSKFFFFLYACGLRSIIT